MLTTAPKGTKDVLPSQSYKWQYIEDIIRRTTDEFSYREIRMPAFEHTELFMRSVGDDTDIVQKEMYTFTDRGGRSITLKPEGTAGAARSFVENALYNDALPQRCYYLYSPAFRYERPQAGRLREHHQFGVEVFGAPSSAMDAEVILLALKVLSRCGLGSLEVSLNSIGCPTCRKAYLETLTAYLNTRVDELCDTCRERMGRNPLRVLDCKSEHCHEIALSAPRITDSLCADCRAHMESLTRYLDDANVKYHIDPMIVRGLDYYTRTVFEIVSHDLGAQGTVCGGGRYNGLVSEVGGPDTPAVGFGMGMERLLLAMEAVGVVIPEPQGTQVYIASMGETAQRKAFALSCRLRDMGVKAEMDCVGRSLKAQFKYAGKLKARYVVVVAEEELESGMWKLKDMATGEESCVEESNIAPMICGAL